MRDQRDIWLKDQQHAGWPDLQEDVAMSVARDDPQAEHRRVKRFHRDEIVTVKGGFDHGLNGDGFGVHDDCSMMKIGR